MFHRHTQPVTGVTNAATGVVSNVAGVGTGAVSGVASGVATGLGAGRYGTGLGGTFVPVAPAPPPPMAAVPLVATYAAVPVAPAIAPAFKEQKYKEKVSTPAAQLAAPTFKEQPAAISAPAVTESLPVAAPAPSALPFLREEPVQFFKEERAAVVKEKILPVEEESIQPVIHREIERREIHEVIQPIHERQVLSPSIEEKQLPAEVRPVQGAYLPRTAALATSSVEYGAVERLQQVRPPIIEETIKKTIVETIQPVIHRETVQPHIIRQTQNIYEKILEPEIVYKETRPLIESSSTYAQPTLTQQSLAQTQTPILQQSGKYVFDIDTKTKVIPHPELTSTAYGTGSTWSGTGSTWSSTGSASAFRPYQK